MTPPPDPKTVKVGVLLAPRPAELGEWLADAAAFEAAGAHALWVDPEPESKLDPLALLAALAALTSRALLVATPPASEYVSEALGRTLATIGRLSHGRLALAAEPGRLEELTDLAPGSVAFRRLTGEPAAFERLDETETGERWVRTPPPEGRAAWRAALAAASRTVPAGCWSPPARGCWTSCATPTSRTTAATSSSPRVEWTRPNPVDVSPQRFENRRSWR